MILFLRKIENYLPEIPGRSSFLFKLLFLLPL